VISTWKSIEDWNHWVNSSERKACQQKIRCHPGGTNENYPI
jgi:heme-degrading monooxygenase HmoA